MREVSAKVWMGKEHQQGMGRCCRTKVSEKLPPSSMGKRQGLGRSCGFQRGAVWKES